MSEPASSVTSDHDRLQQDQIDTSDFSISNSLSEPKCHKFYAVAKGREIGIFTNWNLCQLATEGISGAVHSSFKSLKQASKFLNENRVDTSSNISIYTSAKESQTLIDYCLENDLTLDDESNIQSSQNMMPICILPEIEPTLATSDLPDTDSVFSTPSYVEGFQNEPLIDPLMDDKQMSSPGLNSDKYSDDPEIPCCESLNPDTPCTFRPTLYDKETTTKSNVFSVAHKETTTDPGPDTIEKATITETCESHDVTLPLDSLDTVKDPNNVNFTQKLSEALASICVQLDFKEDLHKLEDNLVNRLIDSEKANTELKMRLIQSDLDHARDTIKMLKKELQAKEANPPSTSDVLLFEAEMDQLKKSHEKEIAMLKSQCELLHMKNENLVEKHKVIEDNLSSQIVMWRQKVDEKCALIESYTQSNKDLKAYMSTLSDEILAMKIQNSTTDAPFQQPKKSARQNERHLQKENIELTNRFSPLQSVEITPNKFVSEINDKENKNPSHKPTDVESSSNFVGDNVDVLIIGISHANRIDANKIYKHKKCLVHTLVSKNILGAEEYIQKCTVASPKVIFYQVADNDLESLPADLCFKETDTLIQMTKQKFPDSKISIGEALPRELNNMKATSEYFLNMENYNKKLHTLEKVHIIRHQNISLQQKHLWSDNKHLSQNGITLFIRNLKTVLNPLLGMKEYENYSHSQTEIKFIPTRQSYGFSHKREPYHPDHSNRPPFVKNRNSYYQPNSHFGNRSTFRTPQPFPANMKTNGLPPGREILDHCQDNWYPSRSPWNLNSPSPEFLNELDSLIKHYKNYS